MAKMGKTDFRQLEAIAKKAEEQLNAEQMNAFNKACAKELAARVLAKVIPRTPVGEYPHRVGGTLRRGWTAGKQMDVLPYVNSLQIEQAGDMVSIEIVNPVEYASYVEFGHRTRNHKGWVEGRFMLTMSVNEVQQEGPAALERKLEKKLKEVFG